MSHLLKPALILMFLVLLGGCSDYFKEYCQKTFECEKGAAEAKPDINIQKHTLSDAVVEIKKTGNPEFIQAHISQKRSGETYSKIAVVDMLPNFIFSRQVDLNEDLYEDLVVVTGYNKSEDSRFQINIFEFTDQGFSSNVFYSAGEPELINTTFRIGRIVYGMTVSNIEWSSFVYYEGDLLFYDDTLSEREDFSDDFEDEEILQQKTWKKKSCFEYDPSKKELKLTVYRGMTLSALAKHFYTSQEKIKAKNPELKNTLHRGKTYIIPVDHLNAELIDVKKGDAIGAIRNRYKINSKYDIRTWNCIPSDRKLMVGSKLLIFTPEK